MNSIILDNFKNLVDFLGMVLGKNAEVVLHELSDFDHSILAISNNLSGREVGGPLTDFALRILKQSKTDNRNFFINYRGKSSCGRDFRSSTMFIRNANGTPAAVADIHRMCFIRSHNDDTRIITFQENEDRALDRNDCILCSRFHILGNQN